MKNNKRIGFLFFTDRHLSNGMFLIVRRHPDIIRIGLLCNASYSGQINRFKGCPSAVVSSVRNAELFDDVAVACQNNHPSTLQIQGNGFCHNLFPHALGHIKEFKIFSPPDEVILENLLYICPTERETLGSPIKGDI